MRDEKDEMVDDTNSGHNVDMKDEDSKVKDDMTDIDNKLK